MEWWKSYQQPIEEKRVAGLWLWAWEEMNEASKVQKLEQKEPKLPPILFLKNWKNNSNVFNNK